MKICGRLSYVKPLNMTFTASGKVAFSPSNSLNWGSMRSRRPVPQGVDVEIRGPSIGGDSSTSFG